MVRTALPLCVGLCLLLAPAGAARGQSAAGARTTADLMKTAFKRPAVNGTFDQALKAVGKLAGVAISVDWPSLLEAEVKPDERVALSPAEATFEQLLEQVLARVSKPGRALAWFLLNDTVCVTTQARVLARGRYLGTVAAAVGPGPGGAPAAATTAPAGGAAPAAQAVGPREFNFDKAPLGDLIEFLRQVSDGVNFHVNYNALEMAGITKDTPVTLKAANISVARALNLLTEQLSAGKGVYDSVYWLVEDGMVKISTGSALDTALQTKVFDVADLLMSVPDFQGPQMDLDLSVQNANNGGGTASGGLFRTDNTNTADQQGSDGVATRKQMEENLISVIKNSIGEDMWKPQGKGEVRILRNMMVISQTRLGFLLLRRSAGL